MLGLAVGVVGLLVGAWVGALVGEWVGLVGLGVGALVGALVKGFGALKVRRRPLPALDHAGVRVTTPSCPRI